MGKVIVYGSISVDGYAAGVDDDLTRLHDWIFDFGERTSLPYSDEFTRSFVNAGAVVFGRRTWDAGQEPWGESTFSSPVFVVTHEVMQPVTKFGTTSTFVSGIENAIERAGRVAGEGTTHIMGSPTVAQQAIAAGLVDELHLHLVPVLLGGGLPFFGVSPLSELELVSFVPSPIVSQARYRLRR